MIDLIFVIIELLVSLLSLFSPDREKGESVATGVLILVFCLLPYCIAVLSGEMRWCVPLGC